jgi:hypothetical protein
LWFLAEMSRLALKLVGCEMVHMDVYGGGTKYTNRHDDLAYIFGFCEFELDFARDGIFSDEHGKEI